MVLYENNYIEKRYWFINKKVAKKIKQHLKLVISDEIENILEYVKEIQAKYNETFDFCDTYFVPEFEEIGDECCSFIIDHSIIQRSNDIVNCIKSLLTEGDWKTFKNVFDILTKIDETEKLNDVIKTWGIENMVHTCCIQCLQKEKSKFKENKFSNICKYLNYFKKIESLLKNFDDLYVLQLECSVKHDINNCYNKNLCGKEPTQAQKSLFANDFAEFIYKFLSNYDKSKSKFDLFNEEKSIAKGQFKG